MVELLANADFTVQAGATDVFPKGSTDPLAAGGPYYPSPGDTVTAHFTWKSSGTLFKGEVWFQKGLTPITETPDTNPDAISYFTAMVSSSSTKTVDITFTVPSDYDGTEPYCFVIHSTASSAIMTVAEASMQGPARNAPSDPGGGEGEDPDPDPGEGEDGGDDGNGSDPSVSDAAQRVADFLGASDDTALLSLAQESVTVITAMVRAYTRNNGFVGTQPNNELSAVITTASARLVANPEQLATDVGTVSTRGGFNGFSLAETFVLNRYRVRAQ